jgi:hypothetical protein
MFFIVFFLENGSLDKLGYKVNWGIKKIYSFFYYFFLENGFLDELGYKGKPGG